MEQVAPTVTIGTSIAGDAWPRQPYPRRSVCSYQKQAGVAISADVHCSIEANQKEIQMKALHSFKLAGISLLLVAGLAACDKPGPAETAGKKIDQTAEAAGKKIEQTAEAAGKKINETTDKVGEKMEEQSAKAGVAIDDAEITAKVKAAIFAEPGLKTLQIGVDTVKGVVTLSGSVDSQTSSDRVKSLAAATAGVKDVDNKLATKSIKTN